jgi:hypothetical protein
MTDKLEPNDVHIRGRVDLTERNGLSDWAARFGVTDDRLFAAVLAVGDDADEVEMYLVRNGAQVFSSWRECTIDRHARYPAKGRVGNP